MATTGFWPVKGHLRDVLVYADNPDKTTDPAYVDEDLRQACFTLLNDLCHG